jgi:hypothetical protein
MGKNDKIDTNKPYPKILKTTSGYVEEEPFRNADLGSGYFCNNCTYFIKDKHCAIVTDGGPDVEGRQSGMIAPHGSCDLWHPNEDVE